MDQATFESIIQEAIAGEVEARDFYRALAAKVASADTASILEGLSQDEASHADQLETLRLDPAAASALEGTAEVSLANELDIPPLTIDLSPRDAIQLAIKKEQAAKLGYLALASVADSAELQQLFTQLADTERRHQAQLEEIVVDMGQSELV
jgi:rubrerythrin